VGYKRGYKSGGGYKRGRSTVVGRKTYVFLLALKKRSEEILSDPATMARYRAQISGGRSLKFGRECFPLTTLNFLEIYDYKTLETQRILCLAAHCGQTRVSVSVCRQADRSSVYRTLYYLGLLDQRSDQPPTAGSSCGFCGRAVHYAGTTARSCTEHAQCIESVLTFGTGAARSLLPASECANSWQVAARNCWLQLVQLYYRDHHDDH
jgi:hypothetical protein